MTFGRQMRLSRSISLVGIAPLENAARGLKCVSRRVVHGVAGERGLMQGYQRQGQVHTGATVTQAVTRLLSINRKTEREHGITTVLHLVFSPNLPIAISLWEFSNVIQFSRVFCEI
jgi:hypothetical protein